MFGALRTLKHYLARQRFKRLVQDFDRQIENARQHHQPVKHLLKAKSDYVRQCLERSVSSRSTGWRGAR
jgi:uncharacterized short protein YbdD (DUF466 family)